MNNTKAYISLLMLAVAARHMTLPLARHFMIVPTTNGGYEDLYWGRTGWAG